MSQPDVAPSAPFTDPTMISDYACNTARLVPGWADLQKMAGLLLAERTPEHSRVLVVGAGGGVELKAFADSHSTWRFVGVDPSRPMLDLAESTLGPLASRVLLHHGYVETAPDGPFDAATCLLTMHFVAVEDRLRTLQEIRRRLVPGAPFVMAHMSFPQDKEEKELWLSRYAAFGICSGVNPENARSAASAIGTRLPILSPGVEEKLLADAGFTGNCLFYAGLAFRGWIAHA